MSYDEKEAIAFLDAIIKLGDRDKEREYMSDSLKFIKSNRKNFEPILTNIVVNLNKIDYKKEWVDLMNIMKEDKSDAKDNYNRWLEELLVKLMKKERMKDGSYKAIDFKESRDKKDVYGPDGYHYDYVKQSLNAILGLDSAIASDKKTIENMYPNLLIVMKAMQNNEKMISFVEKFKKDSKDWKTMVGMLIPVDAQVRLNTEKMDIATTNQVDGIILNRGRIIKESGLKQFANGYFKKQMSIEPGTLRDFKKTKIDVDPEDIELITQDPKIKLPKKGGEQRVSKKQKNSIETAKKTRKKNRNIEIM